MAERKRRNRLELFDACFLLLEIDFTDWDKADTKQVTRAATIGYFKYHGKVFLYRRADRNETGGCALKFVQAGTVVPPVLDNVIDKRRDTQT